MLRIEKEIYDGLGFDLDVEIARYLAALENHSRTVDVPRPVSYPIVEEIVRVGGYEVVEPAPVEQPQEAPLPLSVQINLERDKRIRERFTFQGTPFDFDMASKLRITGAATRANIAILNGAEPGDLRWFNPAVDFSWIASNNIKVMMDAQTCAAFGDTASIHEQRHIFAARYLKDLNPVPTDFTADKYWPTA